MLLPLSAVVAKDADIFDAGLAITAIAVPAYDVLSLLS